MTLNQRFREEREDVGASPGEVSISLRNTTTLMDREKGTEVTGGY